MPLYRKLPHRGFNNFKFRVEYATVNVADLESLGLEEIKREDLVIAGLVRAKDALVKVLGSGELTKKVVVHADKFSASAVAKIEAAGGKAVLNNAE
jgi:large subunit ribosomal protein L15